MAEADKQETGSAGAAGESLPNIAESEPGSPGQSEEQAPLTGLPRWTFSGLAEEEGAAPDVEPPPPPPPSALTADQAPLLPVGTIPSPPEPPPLPAGGEPVSGAPVADPPAAEAAESTAPHPLLEIELPASQETATPEATPDAAPRAETVGEGDVMPEPVAAAPLEAPMETPTSLLPPLPDRPVAPAAEMLPALPDRVVPMPAPAPSASPWNAPAAIQPPAAPWLGPVGKRRRPFAVILLSVITLGIYSLFWHTRVNREMAEFDARLEVNSGASGLAIAIPWLLGLLTTIAGAADLAIRLLHLHVSVTLPSREIGFALLGGIVAVPYLVLLLPISVVAVVMTLERLRVVQERVGIRPDAQVRPVARACLLLLPVIGGLWHLAAAQSRLNRVWHDADPASRPDLVRRPR